MGGSDRGQAYTLEGVIAAIILASALLYGLQAVDVAPYTTDDRSDQRLDSLRTQAADALSVAADQGTLRRAVTCINGSTSGPHSGDPHSLIGQPPNDVSGGNVAGLGAILNGTMDDDDRRYMVLFDYQDPAADRSTYEVVYPNITSANVAFTREPVTVTHRLTVYDSTPLQEPVSGAGCQPTGRTIEERVADGDPFWLPEETRGVSDSELYAVVTVRVIVW